MKERRPGKTEKLIQSSEKPISKKEKKKELARIRSVQNAFDYTKMTKSGLCILDDDLYSKTVTFTDTNYQLLGEDEKYKVFGDYMALLNTHAADRTDLQLTINNRFLDKEKFEDEMLISPQYDGMDKLRFEMNDQRRQALNGGHNKIISQKSLTISGQFPNAEDALLTLNKAADDLGKSLKKLGCEASVMNGKERLDMIYAAIHPGKKFLFEYEKMGFNDSTKNHICPYSLNFGESPAYFRMDDRYCQCLYLSELPSDLSDEFFEELITLEHNFIVSLHMSMIPRKQAIEHIKFQIDDMQQVIQRETRRNARQGGADLLPVSLTDEYNQAVELLEKVERQSQNLFRVQLLVMINASDKLEMDAVRKDIENVAQTYMCKFLPMTYEQEAALNACLPFGKPKPALGRTLISSACSILMPFTTKEKNDTDHPVYYGINKTSHNMIFGNRRLLPNPSGFILGKPGFGKSFSAKLESVSVLLSNPDADVFFIDPQGEYSFMAQELNAISRNAGAAVLKVDSYSHLHFNPFDCDPGEADFIQRKSKFIEFLVAEMIGKGILHPQERTQIGQVCLELFNEFRDAWQNNKDVDPPTLRDFAAKMAVRAADNPFADNIYSSLWPYVDGSSNLFSQQSNVDMTSRFIVFDIHDLDDSIRTLAMKVILETLQQRVKENFRLHKPTYVYIDEIYLLLKDEYSEQFLYEFWKWCRKFGAIVTGITQNVTELLSSQRASTMLANSEFCIMLSQSQNDVSMLKALFRLSDIEEQELLWADKGQGLIKFGNTIIPFENDFPRNTELYRIWNTDPTEKAEVAESFSSPESGSAIDDLVKLHDETKSSKDDEMHDCIAEIAEEKCEDPLKESEPYYLNHADLEPPRFSRNWDEY